MAKIWGPTAFSARKPVPAPAPPPAESAAPAAAAPVPARRTGPLPSLAELGAFDTPAPSPAARASGRLTEADLRGVPAPPPAAPADPLAVDSLPVAGSPSGKTVPGVSVGWSDLNAAVEAGWIRPEAAHALWARWLARKPIVRVEDDGTPLPPLPPSPAPASPPAAGEAAPAAAQAPVAVAPSPAVPQEAPSAAPPAAAAAPRPTADTSQPDVPDVRAVRDAKPTPTPAPPPPDVDDPLNWDEVDFEQPAGPRVRRESSHGGDGASRPRDRDRERTQAPEPAPEVLQGEILEPLEDANARRAAERAAQGPPTIEVVDVIEAPSLTPQPKTRPPGRAWVVGQFALALVGAVIAALSVGLGSTLFGPWGGAVAAAGWSVVLWRACSKWHAAEQRLRALLGVHVLLPLLALAVWQTQVAAGAWPPVQPMDLFAGPPLDTAARALPGLHLDWRWLTLAAVPLVAALVWLVRLRHPFMLASVTGLLWMVAFQAVAGVLQAMGLAFHGMANFMLLLGALTVAAGLYIDLKSRAAGLPDYARWPYLAGAVLMGVGWVSLSTLPMPVPLLRYAGWLVFVLVAVSLVRPSLLVVGLALAGFDLAWALRQSFGSDLLGMGVWGLWLLATAGLVAGLASYLPAAAKPLRFWMPPAWRGYFVPS